MSAQHLAGKIQRARPAGAVWPAISAQTIYNTESTRSTVRVTTLMALASGLDVDWRDLQQRDGLERITNQRIAGAWKGYLVELASSDDDLELAKVSLSFSQAGASIQLESCVIEDDFSEYRDVSVDGSIIHDVAILTSFPVGSNWNQPHGLTQWMLSIGSPHLMIGRINYVAQQNKNIVTSRIILIRAESELLPELLVAAEDSLRSDPHFSTLLQYPRRGAVS